MNRDKYTKGSSKIAINHKLFIFKYFHRSDFGLWQHRYNNEEPCRVSKTN
jgi:hypothetical protein